MNKEELAVLLVDVVRPRYKIENDLGIPKNVLQQAMKGKRNLPKKWAVLLKEYVQKKRYLVANILENKKRSVITEVEEKTEEPNEQSERPLTTIEIIRRKKLGIK